MTPATLINNKRIKVAIDNPVIFHRSVILAAFKTAVAKLVQYSAAVTASPNAKSKPIAAPKIVEMKNKRVTLC